MSDTESENLQESKKALHILYSRRFDEPLHDTSNTRRTLVLHKRIASGCTSFIRQRQRSSAALGREELFRNSTRIS
jgi:hypothetical protein